MKSTLFAWLLFSCCLFNFPVINRANQIEYLDKLIKSRKSANPPIPDAWPDLETNTDFTKVYVSPQDGLMEANKIDALPGQPERVNFDQYSGYVTVDPDAGRALFYYFVESPENSSTKPLVLWLNGGPGCSSVGYGAMEELGPFRVNSDSKTLFRNPYAWNHVSNIIFLDSPAGIGYSYSNTTSDYLNSGDKRTSQDAYIFLINWFERFPQHKTRSFYITGESYSGHYVPQLAYTIILNNKNSNHTVINLKGVAVGNAEIDENNGYLGMYDYFWTHALNSDETNRNIHKFCKQNVTSDACENAQSKGYDTEMGNIDIYNIYADICPCCVEIDNTTKESVHRFNPCTDVFVTDYMNLPEVQKSFHANISDYWSLCSPAKLTWKDSPTTMLPVIQQLIMRNISVWLYSGDIDGRVPVTYTRYTINLLKLPIKSTWRPWHTKKQVAGYVVEYEGVTFVTVRGAGHAVPSYQPEQSLTMISSFLKSELPPSY